MKTIHLLTADDNEEPGAVPAREHGSVLFRPLVELVPGSEGDAFDSRASSTGKAKD
jgi:hypothetical protein